MRFALAFIFISFTQILYAQSDIFDIARNGSINDLKTLISNNKDTINTFNNRGDTPLILACYYGNNEVAKYLVKHVKDINTNTSNGTALMAATYKKNYDLVDYLLVHKANVDLTDQKGLTALIYSILVNDNDIAQLLVKYKAKTSIKDKNNKATIDYALESKNQSIIDLIRNN